MTAVFVNTVTVLIGSLIGLIFSKKINKKYTNALILALALITAVIGLQSAIKTGDMLCVIACLVLGTLVGELIRVDDRIEGAGDWLKKKVLRGKDHSDDAADYDYTKINELLAFNSMEHVDEISVEPVEDIILCGATGFLGMHVLKAFLTKNSGKVYCLIRRGPFNTLEERMKAMLMYYFGDSMEELFGSRIFCVNGDITDPEELKALDNIDASVIINCAACVKHFANDDILDKVNYYGVENLIDVCLRTGKRLVQTSTLSVGGEMNIDHMRTLYENTLFIGQSVDNDYVRTKFLAERAVLQAKADKGLNACIVRLGNLMSRYTDGEFQINFITNSFMRSLWAFNTV